MKKYYVNEIHSVFVPYEEIIIGLFTVDPGHSLEYGHLGEGMGWYVSEYVENIELIAYYIQPRHNGYEPKNHPHLREQIVCDYFDKLTIGSAMWTISFEAENDTTATERFFKEDF